jgi:hypothetical protein
MRTITSACFGFALAISTVTLTGAPASALEIPAVTVAPANNVVKVDEREEFRERGERREREERSEREEQRQRREREEREVRERGERCEHARHECREHHGDRGRELQECLERTRC